MTDVNLHSIQSNPSGSTTRSTYDLSSTDPSTAVVETLAEAKGVDPVTIEPLSTNVDLDALNSLFDPTGDKADCESLVVSFSLPEWEVLLHSDGTVEVSPNETP